MKKLFTILVLLSALVAACGPPTPSPEATATVVPTRTPFVVDESLNCWTLWGLREFYETELGSSDPEIGAKFYRRKQAYAEAFEERCPSFDVMAEAKRRADAGEIPTAPQLSGDPRGRWAEKELGWEWGSFGEWKKSLTSAELVRIIDGDTICVRIGGDQYNVELTGIDAPEQRQCGSEYAEDWLEYFLTDCVGDCSFYLEKDTSETDQHGRLLRYAWVYQDYGITDVGFFEGVGPVALYIDEYIFVNLEMVAAGAAVAHRHPPDVRYAELLERAEQYAYREGYGIWDLCRAPQPTDTPVPPTSPPPQATPMSLTSLPGKTRSHPGVQNFIQSLTGEVEIRKCEFGPACEDHMYNEAIITFVGDYVESVAINAQFPGRHPEVTLPHGLDFSKTREDVWALLGEPDASSDTSDAYDFGSHSLLIIYHPGEIISVIWISL